MVFKVKISYIPSNKQEQQYRRVLIYKKGKRFTQKNQVFTLLGTFQGWCIDSCLQDSFCPLRLKFRDIGLKRSLDGTRSSLSILKLVLQSSKRVTCRGVSVSPRRQFSVQLAINYVAWFIYTSVTQLKRNSQYSASQIYLRYVLSMSACMVFRIPGERMRNTAGLPQSQ